MYTDSGLVIIHDGNYKEFADDPTLPIDGKVRKRGLIPRPYDTHPVGHYENIPSYEAVDFPLIESSQWEELARLNDTEGMDLMSIRDRGFLGQPVPSRDQNGKGYCWAHSGTSAHLLIRARDGQPYADLSAYAIACQIKSFRDEGGWGAQGVDWQIENGVPTSKTWAQQSMSRANVNQAMKDESAKYKIVEGWIDLQAAQYDRNLSMAQNVTCWLRREPTIVDYNWWSHSVCGVKPVFGASVFNQMVRNASGKRSTLQAFEKVWNKGSDVTFGAGAMIWNSWGNSWSQNGMGVLAPSKAVPDGSVALRAVSAAA